MSRILLICFFLFFFLFYFLPLFFLSFNKPSVTTLPLSAQRGILGKFPLHMQNGPLFCVHCLAHNHNRPNCPNRMRCRSCFRYGHPSATCRFPPQSMRQTEQVTRNFALPRNHRQVQSMTSGTKAVNEPRCFASFGEYFTFLTGHSPPPPIVISWGRTWCIRAPDFPEDDEGADDDQVVTTPSSTSSSPVFATFGEFTRVVLGIQSSTSVAHVF